MNTTTIVPAGKDGTETGLHRLNLNYFSNYSADLSSPLSALSEKYRISISAAEEQIRIEADSEDLALVLHEPI